MSWQVNHIGQSPHPGGSFVSASLMGRILAQYMQFYLAILYVEVLNCTSISQGMCFRDLGSFVAIRKSFLRKFWGCGTFGAAKASNLHKFPAIRYIWHVYLL